MGAASYVGRVGRLAVALGVGTAIATGHGVAFADDSPSSEGSTAAAAQTNEAGTAGSQIAAPKPDTEPKTTPSATEVEPSATETTTKTTTANTTNTVAPGVVVSAQTTTGTSASPTEKAEPTDTAEPTETAEPTKTAEPTEPAEPTKTATPKPTAEPDSTPTKNPSASTPAPTTKAVARTAASVDVPKAQDTALSRSATVAALAAATSPADADATIAAPSAARVAAVTVTPPAAPVAAPNPLAMVAGAVSNVVSSVLGWAFGPLAGAAAPSAPAQAPLAWTLLAFVRREIDDFVSSLGGGSATNVALAASQTTTSLALAAAAASNVPGFPLPGAQLSPSTQFVNWVTGDYYNTGNTALDWPDTLARFGVSGTDIGVMWDNGMVDDPSTPYNEHQILMAFGDTFGLRSVPGEDWRFNVLMRSADTDLTNGIDVPDGEFGNGNMFGGMPLWDVPPGRPYENYARRIINPEALPPGAAAGITLIPTAGISLPTPGTRFGVTQYINFMSVTNWGSPGQWTTNFSGIAYSTDNGENWSVAPTSIRYNDPWSGNANFQQGAFVRPGDGYVYSYGTPNGRQGAAYVSRVLEKDILDVSKYEYYSKGNPGGWFGWGATPAGWQRNNPAAATPVFGQDQGACGVANAGNQVSEMSVQYNKQLNKYVTLYGDQFNNIVMRTSDTPQGTWSAAKVLIGQQPGGIYAPMMHPWSPSTMGKGTDLYWNLSWWGEYNVSLMRTDLTKV
jgi:hypothetical protein